MWSYKPLVDSKDVQGKIFKEDQGYNFQRRPIPIRAFFIVSFI